MSENARVKVIIKMHFVLYTPFFKVIMIASFFQALQTLSTCRSNFREYLRPGITAPLEKNDKVQSSKQFFSSSKSGGKLQPEKNTASRSMQNTNNSAKSTYSNGDNTFDSNKGLRVNVLPVEEHGSHFSNTYDKEAISSFCEESGRQSCAEADQTFMDLGEDDDILKVVRKFIDIKELQ